MNVIKNREILQHQPVNMKVQPKIEDNKTITTSQPLRSLS